MLLSTDLCLVASVEGKWRWKCSENVHDVTYMQQNTNWQIRCQSPYVLVVQNSSYSVIYKMTEILFSQSSLGCEVLNQGTKRLGFWSNRSLEHCILQRGEMLWLNMVDSGREAETHASVRSFLAVLLTKGLPSPRKKKKNLPALLHWRFKF